MSQNPPDGWASPSSGEQADPSPPPPPAPPPVSWGQPSPPVGYPPPGPQLATGYPPQQYGPQYGQPYGPPYQASYAPPPPKPGVIPLRPLGLNEILDGAVQTIRQNPVVMLGLSALVNVVLTLIVVLIQIGNLRTAFGGLSSFSSSSNQAEVDASQLVASAVAALLQFVGTTLLTGLLVIAVSDAVLGRRPSIGEVWQRAKGRLWALLGVTVLVLLVVFGLVALCLLPGILLAVADSGGVAAVLLILFGALAALVLSFWIAIRLLFAPPTVLLERTGVFASIRRSWRLVGGSWWRCFGIWLLAQVLGSVLSGVLQFPLLILAAVAGGGGAGAVVIALTILASVVARTLVAPFSAAILALLYIDLRMRREGLDVRLQQAAAAQ
jgi:Membrane domain of glycerophosphoryl diester phosphodiesterase